MLFAESGTSTLTTKIPAGYVKYKIRRPQTTSYFAKNMEKRIDKSIRQASKDLDLDEDISITTETFREITITSTKSRPKTGKSRIRKLEDFSKRDDGIFEVDYPFLESFHQLKDLENIWRLHNNVELDCMELKSEKAMLLQENKHLRGMMRSILEAAALDRSGMGTRIPTRVCSRYKATKSAPPIRQQRRKA